MSNEHRINAAGTPSVFLVADPAETIEEMRLLRMPNVARVSCHVEVLNLLKLTEQKRFN
jgi:hypothetical protein